MTSRKNILILMHNDAIQFIDIANQYVKSFDPTQYHVTVAYLSGQPNKQTRLRTLSEEVIFLNCAKKDIRYLKINAIKKLITLCRERKFFIVVSHRYKPIYVMLWTAQFCNIPTLVFVMHAMKTLNSIPRKILFAGLMRKNMYLAGVSNAVRDDLRKNTWGIAKDRIITLYNCIDVETTQNKLLTRNDARKYLNISENDFIFGTVGRLAPEKDQRNIIQAFAKIKSQLPKAKLLLIGDGPLENELKKLALDLDLQNEIIFTGFIQDALYYLKALDVFMLTSTKEAFGRVLLEAMIAKVPMIGTQTNGIPEVIGDAGILVEARNPDKLSAAMLSLAESSPQKLLEWGEKGFRRVEEKFSVTTFSLLSL